MSQNSGKPSVTLICGFSGSGKTTFMLRYILNRARVQALNPFPAACVFLFDAGINGKTIASTLGINAVTTQHGCQDALKSRLVCFNPHIAFPGNLRVKNPEGEWVMNDDRQALRWFARWCDEVSATGPGQKILVVDEFENFSSKFYVPPEIESIARRGRHTGLELVLLSQFPRDFHANLRSSITELICFNTTEPAEIEAIRHLIPNPERLARLATGEFIAINRLTRAEITGKLF